MSLSVGEILARRKLEKAEAGFNEHYVPGQHRAITVEDKAVLSWVDGVGKLVIAACHKVAGQDQIEEWVLMKPCHVVTVGLNGQIEAVPFATSYPFNDEQINALNAAAEKRGKKKKEDE